MAYIKTEWVDGENKYSITDQAGNIIPGFENIKLLYAGIGGTPLSQEKMNKIEQGIVTHEETAATETLAAHVELATQAEVSLGVDSSKVVTSATLHGVVSGTAIASDTLRASNNETCTNDTVTYIKQKAFTVNIDGVHRVKFDLYEGDNAARGMIYKNGVPFGTECINGTHVWVTYSEDLTFATGDTCELWLRMNTLGPTAYARNFQLYFDVKRDVIFDITPELPVSIYP